MILNDTNSEEGRLMINEFYNYLISKLELINDSWTKKKVYDIDLNEIDEISWRQSSLPTFTKWNDDIVIWHKGGPNFFLRYAEVNTKSYRNYDEIVIDNKTIGLSIMENKLVCLEYNENEDIS